MTVHLLAAVPQLSWSEALLRIVLAAVFGGAIGLEREFREREAGLRTHSLVSVGSALFTITSAYGFHDFLIHNGGGVVRADPARIAAQIVTGIGFLGAGAIIRQGLAVRGLTTAATLWVVAAIGLASGAGYYSAALMTTIVVVFLLWPMRYVARRLFERPHEHRLGVQLAAGTSAATLVEALERLGVRIESFELGDEDALDLLLNLPRGIAPDVIVRQLVSRPEVRSASWRTSSTAPPTSRLVERERRRSGAESSRSPRSPAESWPRSGRSPARPCRRSSAWTSSSAQQSSGRLLHPNTSRAGGTRPHD